MPPMYSRIEVGCAAGLPPVQLSYSAWGAAERAFWQPVPKSISTFLSGNPTWREHSGCWTTPVDSHAMSSPLQRSVSLIPANLGRAARELARRNGVTLFSTLLTAFRVALSRWTGAHGHRRRHSGGQSKQAGNARDHGLLFRHRPASGTRRARPAILRWSSSRASGIDRLLCQCHSLCRAHARALGDPPSPGHTPIFDVRFALQNHPAPVCRGARDCLSSSKCVPQARPVSISVAKSQKMARLWRWSGYFDRNYFPKQKFKNLSSLFEAVLAGFARSPDSRTAALTI